MKRKLAICLSLGALVLGVGSLSSGIAVLIAITAFELLEISFGFGLLLAGLASWIGGVVLLKNAAHLPGRPRPRK